VQPYAYFQYGWGWDVWTGPLCLHPEFKKPLGKPLGDATRDKPDGWVFRRRLECARVTVDLDRRDGCVEWK